MGRFNSIFSILVFAPLLVSADPHPILISTIVAGERVRDLQAKLHSITECGSPETCEEANGQREPSFNELRTTISEFVVSQLDAEPKLDRAQLRDQLNRVLGPSAGGPSEAPYIFRSPVAWEPNQGEPVVWAVAYQEWTHAGMGGARTVVDCYVVERGRARLAGRGGAEMSGYGLSIHEILIPSSNSLFILIQGRLEWASGHELPAKATLYAVNHAGIQTIWESKMLPGLDVSTRPDHAEFSVRYHDEARHQANFQDPHTTVVETYVVGPEGVTRISTERP
jgi:hypothetical protein